MSKIITTTLEKICRPEKGEIISGPFGSNISSKYFVEEGIPVIRGNNLSLSLDKFYDDGFVFVTQEKADELNCYAKKMDLIFTSAGTIGQVGLIPNTTRFDKYVISNKQIRARIDTDKVDVLYAYYWFASPWIQKLLILSNKGSTVPLLTLWEVKNLPISYPENIEEQHNIALVLETITKKIENNNRINRELESMAKTIYDYWFLQFEFPNENGKPYKSSGGKMVWNDELKREIPEEWKTCKVRDCIAHINTGLNPRDNFVLGNGAIKYITVKNITTDGKLDFLNCDTIDENAKKIIHRRSDISKGDILFASIAPLGRCFLIQEEPVNWDINESVFSIRPNYNNMTSEYLYMFFMSPYFIKNAEHNSIGSVFNGIRISTLENMLIIIPPDKIMNQFKDSVHHILFARNHRELESIELEALRNFLLPLLMNGQVGFRD